MQELNRLSDSLLECQLIPKENSDIALILIKVRFNVNYYSTFEVQTHAARRDGQKASRANNQRWAFFKNWLKRSATKRKSSVKS